MAEPTSCCVRAGSHCARVDILFNLPGVHVLDVTWRERSGITAAGLRLLVETDPAETGCPGCEGDCDRARTPAPQAARHPCVRCCCPDSRCVSFRGNHQRRPVARSGPGRGNAAGVPSRHSGPGCRRGVPGDQGSLRDQYGGRLVAHRAGNGGQLCRRLRVNRLVAAIRGQAPHHGVHLVSRGTGGGHRGAARYRDADEVLDPTPDLRSAVRRRLPCRLGLRVPNPHSVCRDRTGRCCRSPW